MLANIGRDAVKIYDSFTWAPQIEYDRDNNIEAQPGENKHDLQTVFSKFDRYYGVHNSRNIKRQEFLKIRRRKNTIMDYISELKHKVEFLDYVKQKLICDMIINRVYNIKCLQKLMENLAGKLTMDKVIQTCRQAELTNVHLKTLDAENPSVILAKTKHNTSYEEPRTFGQPAQLRSIHRGSR